MSDFIPPMIRWDDSMYPIILISECRRYMIDGENHIPYFVLVRLPDILLSNYRNIDDAKVGAYRHLLAKIQQGSKPDLKFYGINV